MGVTLAQLGLYLPAAAVFGGIIVWLVNRREISGKLDAADGAWQTRFDKASSDKERLKIENRTLKASLEAEREVLLKHKEAAILSRTELESSRTQTITLRKELFVATEQRSEFQNKLAKRHSPTPPYPLKTLTKPKLSISTRTVDRSS